MYGEMSRFLVNNTSGKVFLPLPGILLCIQHQAGEDCPVMTARVHIWRVGNAVTGEGEFRE